MAYIREYPVTFNINFYPPPPPHPPPRMAGFQTRCLDAIFKGANKISTLQTNSARVLTIKFIVSTLHLMNPFEFIFRKAPAKI